MLFGEERYAFLGYIASEAQRLTAIVDTLLSVARLDAGDLKVELAPTDVGSLVSEVVLSAQQSGVNGNKFVVNVPEEQLAASADSEKLRQVIINLLDNAVKFSPRGGTVTVEARQAGHTVEVRVVDEGIGVRQPSGRKSSGSFIAPRGSPESGVGRGWASSHVGSLLRWGAGSGSTPPRAAARASHSSFRWRWAVLAGLTTGRTGIQEEMSAKVLVIDDEAPIRLLCRVNLEAEGMEVIEAQDGTVGVELARSERPDVILLDVMMPGMDGWEVLQALQDGEGTSEIPIVFLTARAELRDRAQGLELGGIDYVTKPFNPIDLAPRQRSPCSGRARGTGSDPPGTDRSAAGAADRVAERGASARAEALNDLFGRVARVLAGEVGCHASRQATCHADTDLAEAPIEEYRPVGRTRHPHLHDDPGVEAGLGRVGEVLPERSSANAEAA